MVGAEPTPFGRFRAGWPVAETGKDLVGLLAMLMYRGPHRSKTERKFINIFLNPLDVVADPFGNRYKKVGEAPVMWSSHTDTVHRRSGLQWLGFDKTEIG